MTLSNRIIAAMVFGFSLTALSGYQTAIGGAVGANRSQLMQGPSMQSDEMTVESDAKLLSGASHKNVLNQNYAILKRAPTITERFDSQTPGEYCANASDWQWEIYGWQWDNNVITGNKLNAFCLPGDKIIIYSGLINHNWTLSTP